MKPRKIQNAPFFCPWFGGGGGGGGADVGGINFPSILSKIVVEVIEEKSLRQYIIFITIVPLFNTQHQNLF